MSISRLNAAQVSELINENHVFVDVREISEIQQSRFIINNLKILPLSELGEKFSSVLPVDKSVPIILLCRGGGRSLKAASYLENQGFQNLINLEGGILQWEKDGYPIEGSTALSEESSCCATTDITNTATGSENMGDCCSKPGCC